MEMEMSRVIGRKGVQIRDFELEGNEVAEDGEVESKVFETGQSEVLQSPSRRAREAPERLREWRFKRSELEVGKDWLWSKVESGAGEDEVTDAGLSEEEHAYRLGGSIRRGGIASCEIQSAEWQRERAKQRRQSFQLVLVRPRHSQAGDEGAQPEKSFENKRRTF